jgi:hypothetical protein
MGASVAMLEAFYGHATNVGKVGELTKFRPRTKAAVCCRARSLTSQISLGLPLGLPLRPFWNLGLPVLFTHPVPCCSQVQSKKIPKVLYAPLVQMGSHRGTHTRHSHNPKRMSALEKSGHWNRTIDSAAPGADIVYGSDGMPNIFKGLNSSLPRTVECV